MLHKGQPRGRLEVTLCLLLSSMRRVIGGDNVDHIVTDALNQPFPIGWRFDSRVALYVATQIRVTQLIEPQVMDASLGRDQFLLYRPRLEQLQLTRCAQMQHVKPRSKTFCQIDGQRGGLVTGFGGTDLWVRFHRHVLTETLSKNRFISPYGGRVLTMGSYRQRRFREYPL